MPTSLLSRSNLHALLAGACLLAFLAVMHGVGRWVAQRTADELAGSAAQRLEIYEASLNDAIERFAYFPATVSLNDDLVALIDQPNGAALLRRANRYLETAAQTSGAIVLYLMDKRGKTLASSNWNTPLSYVGMNFAFRPYVQAALQGEQGRFYAIGVVTRTPGYFISAPVRRDGRVIGAVAIKVSLDATEEHWRESGERILVTDASGIVALSSEAAWKFRVLAPLREEQRWQQQRTRQYENQSFAPLVLSAEDESGRVRVDGNETGHGYIVATRDMPLHGWQLRLLADARPVTIAVRTARVVTALALLALVLLLLYRAQRLRRIRDNLAAQRVLERAHADLERQVEMRTADLRNAQNELVQAAKLAVLGQMAAGVTHELNQPLTATRSLAENARRFLEQGNVAQADRNLLLIAQLVERMGRITGQLRNFSRKSEGDVQPVALGAAVDDALSLLEERIRKAGVHITQESGLAGASVMFDPLRLQQVLVNLLRNALDALAGTEAPRIDIGLREEGGRLVLSIADNGPGIAPELLPRIFEPFFTTKPSGEGLGLGLAISQAIAGECGARLVAGEHPAGGACFELHLHPASAEFAEPAGSAEERKDHA